MSAPAAQTDIQAALLLLDRLGVTTDDLLRTHARRPVPTFAQYVPLVYAAMPAGRTREDYLSYWKKTVAAWPDRRIDEPTPSEFKQLLATFQAERRIRSCDRGGHGIGRLAITAWRCLYSHAVDDGLIRPIDNPAAKLAKPRPRPSSRRALPTDRLAEINRVAAQHGDDPELTTLILRLCTETACRRGGILALRRHDLDPDQCLILLREKGDKQRWQPVSPTLMHALLAHHSSRTARRDTPKPYARNGRPISATAEQRLLRYSNGNPIGATRFEIMWQQIGQQLPWVGQQGITCHWLRHTTLRWVERNFGHAVARAYAGHADSHSHGATSIYTRAGLEEVAHALSVLTDEPHPLAPGRATPLLSGWSAPSAIRSTANAPDTAARTAAQPPPASSPISST
ncbi:site-specific integrase [Nocardia abscessus]|uniref:site-specific integrase n=1 Tax=Nocardia abscessus TaxID=120957 RepID=UPI002457821A|nr:site-specific integrase [Nocardia abscessus]